MQKSKCQISHVVSHSQKCQIYNVFSYQYRYENLNGNMCVHNNFLGTCHVCTLGLLEYILGEITWNNI